MANEKLEKLLEDVALDTATLDGISFEEIRQYDLAILKRRLLPLLLAGQAMRDFEMEHPSGFTRWDAALAAALGESK